MRADRSILKNPRGFEITLFSVSSQHSTSCLETEGVARLAKCSTTLEALLSDDPIVLRLRAFFMFEAEFYNLNENILMTFEGKVRYMR